MDESRFGLKLSEGRLVWGGSAWLPEYLQMAIIGAWNPIACHFLGHRYLGRAAPGQQPVCSDCCQAIQDGDFNEDEVMNEFDEDEIMLDEDKEG
jgi:hypothetical protein